MEKQEEDKADFKDADIDEKETDILNEVSNPDIQHKSFVPHAFADRKLPKAPGFGNKNSISYLKNIATPMQNRRKIKDKEEKKVVGSYFQKLTAPMQSILVIDNNLVENLEEHKIILKIPNAEENPDEFQTAMDHPNINVIEVQPEEEKKSKGIVKPPEKLNPFLGNVPETVEEPNSTIPKFGHASKIRNSLRDKL